MKTVIINTLKLFVVCLLSVAALAAVNMFTTRKIADNEEKSKQLALSHVLPASSFEKQELKDNSYGVFEMYKGLDESGTIAGAVIFLNTKGYGGDITVAVGVSATGEITGVEVNSHGETPGLGERVTHKEFLDQFKGGRAPYKLKDIDGITGATISTNAMIKGINSAAEYFAAYVQEVN